MPSPWLQTSAANGYSQHATQEQLDSLHTLRNRMVSSQGPQRGSSGWQAQGLSREQLSEAAQYYLTNLERVLHSQLITLREVSCFCTACHSQMLVASCAECIAEIACFT